MKKIFLLIIAGSAALYSCKNKTAPEKKEGPKETKQGYLPIQDFIREDIKKTDSFAGGILTKTMISGKKDSFYIQLEEFHKKATVFFSDELDSAKFQESFRENSFMDETTQTLQFVYEANNNINLLRKIIVYIKPSLTVDKVSGIYIEKESARGDTIIQEKLTWKMQQYFIKVTIKEINGKAFTEIEKVIWDPLQFAED